MNIRNFIGADAEFADASHVIFGAPYDSTTSYRPGTRNGPAAVRSEAYGIETYSPYQDKDLEDIKVCDDGDLELPFGAPEVPLQMIEDEAAKIFDAGKVPVMLGGEHLVTLGTVRAAVKRFKDLHIIHFDAHTDLRDDYLGNKLSHATVMRRCWELVGDGHIHQIGIRSGMREEFQLRDNKRICVGLSSDLSGRACRPATAAPVYLTVDQDCLDPSEFPGTGTQEAGGLRFRELLDMLLDIFRRFNVIGFDLVELSPNLDPSGRSTALTCKLLRECLLASSSDGLQPVK